MNNSVRLSLYLSAAFACSAFGLLCLKVMEEVSSISGDLRVTLVNVSQASRTADQVLAQWQARQVHDQAQVEGAIHETRQTMLELHRAGYNLNKFIGSTQKDTHRLLTDLDQSITDSDRNLATLTSRTTSSIESFGTGMQEVTANATRATAAATEALEAANRTLSDPAIAEAIHHTDASTANIEKTTAHVEKTTGDLEEYAHRLVAPASWAKRVGEAIADYAIRFWGAFEGAR